MNADSDPSLSELYLLIDKHFDLEEIYTLSFDLGIDLDSLPGETKRRKIRQLIAYSRRRGRLHDLAKLLQERRPNVAWHVAWRSEALVPAGRVRFPVTPTAPISVATIIVIGLLVAIFTLLLSRITLFDRYIAGAPLPLEIASGIVVQTEDRFGELTINYPSYLRPSSSERIDLTIRVPPEIASIRPIQLERLPNTITPTLRVLDRHRTHTLVSERMAAVLTSPTFATESVFPERQLIAFNGDTTTWAWNVTAPDVLSTGVVTLKLFKLDSDSTELNDLAPSWAGTIQIDVIQFTPTPPSTATAVPTPTLPPPTATTVPTPTFIERATNSLAENSVVVVGGLLTLFGVVITALIGPMILDWWRNRKKKDDPKASIAELHQGAALETIKDCEDISQLKAWLVDEQKAKNRVTVKRALEKRISVLETTRGQ